MTKYQNYPKLALMAFSILTLTACSGGGGGSDPVVNSAPAFANSNVSIEVQENSTGVIYSASATDAEGNTINYSLSGGADQSQFSIGTSNGELQFKNSPDYENPSDNGGNNVYEVQISASDSLANSSMKLTVTISNVVEDGEDGGGSNRAPTAIISVSPDPDNTTLTTTTEITLDGSTSSNPDGDTLTYEWSQPSGQSIDLSSTSTASTTFTAANPGTYTFTLTVDDGRLTDSSEVTLEIIQTNSTNRAPTAIISVSPDPDSTTLTTATETTLNGSDSSDPDGDTLAYEWSQPSSQSIDLSSTSNASTTFTAANPGTYTFTLTVDDGSLTDSGEVTLEILQADSAPSNRAPTAIISVSSDPDSTTLTTATEITLNGSDSSDPDGDALDYTWSQPSSQSIDLSSTSSASTTFTAANPGTYTFTLTVDDGSLANSAEVILEIAQANRAPTAIISVSPDHDGMSPLKTETEVTLDGHSSSDPDGDELNFAWSQPSSQSIDLSSDSASATKFTATTAGIYTFTLNVNDGEFEDSSTVTLEIEQANRVPIASISVNPDPDSTTLTTETEVTLDGSDSSDPDGDMLAFSWSQPNGQSIDLSSIYTSSTKFTTPISDTYTFTLTVSDGELENDTEITVIIHPVTLPDDFTATYGDTKVTLTWTSYSNDTIYNIYRSTDHDCDLDNYSTACSASDGELFSNKLSGFIDTGLTNKITYYYWIEAVLNGSIQRTTSPVSAVPRQITTSDSIVGTLTGILNDTGIVWGGKGDDYEGLDDPSEYNPYGNNIDCSSNISAPQDCHQGRDATANDDSDGRASFSFTKLDSNGNTLNSDATTWSCVLDNVTGLVWEVKTDDGGLHDKDDKYSWYNTDPYTNGGSEGYANNSTICYGYDSSNPATYCNTEAFSSRVNSNSLCGYSNWRLPSKEEVYSIVDYGSYSPAIDISYFPNSSDRVWTSSPIPGESYDLWYVSLANGINGPAKYDTTLSIRLVVSPP